MQTILKQHGEPSTSCRREGNWFWIQWLSLISLHREFSYRAGCRSSVSTDMQRIFFVSQRHSIGLNRSRRRRHRWVTLSLLNEHIISINNSSICKLAFRPPSIMLRFEKLLLLNQMFWKQMKFCFCYVYLWTRQNRQLDCLHRHLFQSSASARTFSRRKETT